jgi:hypothetical protein
MALAQQSVRPMRTHDGSYQGAGVWALITQFGVDYVGWIDEKRCTLRDCRRPRAKGPRRGVTHAQAQADDIQTRLVTESLTDEKRAELTAAYLSASQNVCTLWYA